MKKDFRPEFDRLSQRLAASAEKIKDPDLKVLTGLLPLSPVPIMSIPYSKKQYKLKL